MLLNENRNTELLYNYTSVVGSKFMKDGSPRSYPGNTIICSINPDSSVHNTLNTIQASLKAASFGKYFSFLPAASFHMTLLRGVNHQVRIPEEWVKDVPMDTPIDEITEIFRQRISNVSLPDSFKMKPVRFGNAASGESQLYIEPYDSDEAEKINRARTTLHRNLNHGRSLSAPYEYHITFSYQILLLNKKEKNNLKAINKELFQLFSAKHDSFFVSKPVLCRYDDMMSFSPVTIPERNKS